MSYCYYLAERKNSPTLAEVNINQATMTTIQFKDQKFTIMEGTSVLDVLLENGQNIPYGCRAGACHACILIAKPEQIPDDCQAGLSTAEVQKGYFLSCQCQAEIDMQVAIPDRCSEKIVVTIADKYMLNKRTLGLRLNSRLRWQAGQYLTLWINDHCARCYSIASVARLDSQMELHIRVHPNGQVSQHLIDHCDIGDTLQVQGPLGSCSYQDDKPEQTLILLAEGTGLSPILGIIRDALAQNHRGNINLLISNRQAEDFYLLGELAELKKQYSLFNYQLALSKPKDDSEPSSTAWNTPIDAQLRRDFSVLRGHKVYICGGIEFVSSLKKQCFLQGASPRDIICEEFINFSAAK
jgi:CDP-4-dehydro-6-deoxyglucose reductase